MVQGNGGQLAYSYPLTVASGPSGTVPTLAVTYSSASTNARHSPTSPAESVGEGWSLTMGAITAEQYPDGTIWYSISGVDNVSDRLVPDSGGDDWVTEHLSYLKISKVTGSNGQSCFDVWDTSGNFYEFGCTADALQYYNKSASGQTNYRWDLDRLVPANEGPGTDTRVMNLSYLQDIENENSTTSVRDAALKQITYGTTTTRAGTIDFFYNGPSTQSPWETQYSSSYETACNLPATGGQPERCDDPIDRGTAGADPAVMSTLSLQTIKTYVGDDSSSSHLDYSYSFAYKDTAFGDCPGADTTLSDYYCAGDHLLTSITPTVYQNGTAHALPATTFGYTGRILSAKDARVNKYDDVSQDYHMETSWNYLTSYHDHRTGTGASSIVYHSAYNNSHGTPYSSEGDNRYDALYCVWHPDDCNSGTAFYPMDDKMWTEQVVTQITGVGTDSSASSLKPEQTSYSYWLTKTQGTCPTDSQGNSDCVGDGWIPNSTDTQSYEDYYHGEFKGFGTVLIVNTAGDLTVRKYATTWGWDSPESDPRNYLAGSLLEEDVYQGGDVDQSKLIRQTVNTYAGQNSTPTACSSKYLATAYDACEVILTSSKTTLYEQSGNAGPWAQQAYTYDDYRSTCGQTSCLGDNHQSPATGSYHNLQQAVTTSSNAPTVTQNWTYNTTNTTVSGHVYYNVHRVASSNVVDASNHTWQCQNTIYDEGIASGIPQPAAGWPTTTTTYSNCANQSSTALKAYNGYDANGNVVASVDAVEAGNPSLYSSVGCTLSTAPLIFATSNWSGSHYTGCSKYDGSSALPTNTWNALGHHSSTSYDATQGLLPLSSTDSNGQTTTNNYSYDSNGNPTLKVSEPGESSTSYTTQASEKMTCTDSSTLPCVEVDHNVSLYSNAVSRTFYDSHGRAVETLTPGPDSTHMTVSFTVYNDAARSAFSSLPFRVATRTTWLDPNTATDETGQSPKGSETDLDAIGRVIKTIDPLGNSSTITYSLDTSGVSGDSNNYAITTAVDANAHVALSYTDALGRLIYTVDDSGTNGGTLSPNRRKTFQYNVLGEPVSVTVTDLAPRSGQSVTTVTTTAQYDDLGRMTSLNDPDRGAHTYTYDADGHMLTDISGTRTLGMSYDVLGRMGCVQNAAPTADPHGACTSGANPLVQNTYDADPSGVTWSGSTYPVGRLTQSIATTYFPDPDDSQGKVTENMQYDTRGRPVTERMQIVVNGGTIAFPTFPQYQQTLAYNDADQPTTTTTTVGGQTGYTFTQSYDSTLGLLNGLSNTSTAAPSLVGLSYNEQHGLLSDLTLKDSAGATLATEHLSYDGVLRPASETTTWQSNGSAIYSDSVGYDKVGNVLSRATTQATVPSVTGSGGSETQNFCYDEQGRMVWASNSTAASAGSGQICGTAALQGTLGSGYTSSYVYTHLGQLWQGPLNGSGAQQQYLYCNSSHPHQVTALSPASGNPTCSASGTPSYSGAYDNWGNLITRSTGSSNGSLSFSFLDQLRRWNGTTASSSQEEWYLYDASGNRVLRRSATTAPSGNPATAAATITVYAFGLEEHVYSYSGSGTSLTNTGNTYYYSIGGHPIGTLSGMTGSLKTNFLLTDTLGSVVTTISNTAGSADVLGTQLYGPYGNKRSSAGSMGTAKGYTGQYNDDVTGLDYYNARYYDPLIGRFLSADPVQGNLGGMDPYNYVGGNPETNNDPTGHLVLGPNGQTALPGGGTVVTPAPAPAPAPLTVAASATKDPAESPAVQKVASYFAGTSLGDGGTQSSGSNQPTIQIKNEWPDSNQNNALCPNGNTASDCFKWTVLSVHSQDTQITLPTIGGFSTTFHVKTVSFSPFTFCTNPAACLEEGQNDSKGESESYDTEFFGCGMLSFTPQTVVTTDQGKRPISKLRPGDQVWAYNPETHKMELQPIVHVWVHQDDDLVDLTITFTKSTSHGKTKLPESEAIHTNKKHPFLTLEKSFLPVGQITVGMHVQRADGSIGLITGWTLVPGVKTMYNLKVAQDHTFIVGDGQWIVHNCARSGTSGNGSAAQLGNQFHYDTTHGGPAQLQNMYPTTNFEFTSRGAAGADVHVVGGDHPSNTSVYPGSTWYPGSDYADFKPNSWNVGSRSKFNREIRTGKLPAGTVPIWYDPIGYIISAIG